VRAHTGALRTVPIVAAEGAQAHEAVSLAGRRRALDAGERGRCRRRLDDGERRPADGRGGYPCGGRRIGDGAADGDGGGFGLGAEEQAGHGGGDEVRLGDDARDGGGLRRDRCAGLGHTHGAGGCLGGVARAVGVDEGVGG
jgi:hypothetical protein